MQKVPEAGCENQSCSTQDSLVFPLREKKNRHAATHRPTDSQAALPRRAQGDFFITAVKRFLRGHSRRLGSGLSNQTETHFQSHTAIPAIATAAASRSSSSRQPKVWRGRRRAAKGSSGLTGMMWVLYSHKVNCNLTLCE